MSSPPHSSVPPEILRVLRLCPVFRGFTDAGLNLLGALVQVKHAPPGTPLFVEHMLGESLFVVAEGTIRLSARGPGGEELVLGRVGPPESLGEAALLRPGQRQCSATAESAAVVFEILRRDVIALQKTKPQACLKLLMGVVELVGERMRAAEPELKDFLAWRLGP